ncbi:DUF1294 domain-containing protein [Alloscardovia theropitheci]|uniref:DUF1294 domain-containing protein n=2 Tax=Alloscardovia theropitheci TaxID=2496842 RepID=A0A4R0QRU4_9BIFI|nr:DUF1294 domain-containing protein [Alloscardovia theropitheci]
MVLAWKLEWIHFAYTGDDLFDIALYRKDRLINIGWYCVIINTLSFILFGIDKWIAKRNGKNKKSTRAHTRIPEFWLLGSAFLGGTIGSIIAMAIFRHKINDWYFVWEVPIFLCLHACLFFYIHAVGIF